MAPASRFLSSVAALALSFAGAARAEPPTDAQIDAMTDAMIEMFPIARVLEDAAAHDPQWPMQDLAGKVNASQLACMRQALSAPGVRRAKRADVVKYADAHAASFAADLKTARGAAPLLGALSSAGMKAGADAGSVDYAGIMKSATTDQYLAMVVLSRDPANADLRELSGFGASIAQDDAGSNAAKGKAVGELIVTRLLLGAMKTCDVPMSVLVE